MSDAKSPPDLSMDEILATIRRIIAEDEQPGASVTAAGMAAAAAPPAAERPRPADDDDVLELTEALGADGNVRHLAPIGASSRAPAATREPPPLKTETATLEARPETPPLRLVPEPVPAAAEPPPGGAEAPATPPSLGARTLEDIVSDLLRPMLRDWLDANLPALVERLVQAERARVTSGAGSA
jgi:hypothetical protein